MLWFKHDANARNSLKLRKVRRKFGADGYAIYWFCLEAIAYEVDKDNLTFDLKEDAETIGFELSIQEHRVEEIMTYMVQIGLFESSNNVITCLKLAERLDKSMTNSPKMRKWLEGKSVMTLPDDVSTCHERIDKKRIEVEENKNITTSAKPKYEDCDLLFAQKAYSTIRTRLPDFKKPNLETWAKDVRLMREQDNRRLDQMEIVFVWAQYDHFWQSNILSMSKFRKQYDTLSARMIADSQPRQTKAQKTRQKIMDMDL